MKVVILAGGLGSRLSEETYLIPKPMVEIGGRPIIWHIMKHFSEFGFNEFILLLGYKSQIVKDYFINYHLHSGSISINLENQKIKSIDQKIEPWDITLLDTGADTDTGGRIKRAEHIIGDEKFFLTYGDGVSNINLNKLLDFHEKNEASITMSGVQPYGQFGTFEEDENNLVKSFLEKPKGKGSWVNGGFFVCEKDIFDYLNDGDKTIFEREPLENLASDSKLYCFHHDGFWKCMDTLKDKQELQKMWESSPPWKIW
jgi:glucose-1-phosphate cytidylyltransferase